MEINIDTLTPLFENPAKSFQIREVARLTGINHTTIRQHLNKAVKEGLLIKEAGGIYPAYRVSVSLKYINLKLFYNLEKLRKSKIIEEINDKFDFPVIVVFGSYSKAIDGIESDVDLCVISDVNKRISFEKFKKIMNREISLHQFSRKEWNLAKTKNPNLINSICNGIVLSGELEVL